MPLSLYAGVDIHKEKYVGCILNKEGNVIREHTFPPTPGGAQAFLAGMPVKGIAVEACTMWRAAKTLFGELGYSIALSSPKKTHDIACRKKTDKVDAKILADLLRTGYLPKVYVPSEEILQLRDLCRHKAMLTQLRVSIQNKIKCRLLVQGIPYPKNLWTEKNLTILRSWNDPLASNLLEIRESIRREEDEVLSRVESKAQSSRLANLLKTVPGIGHFGALMMLGEIADIKRFSSSKKLIMYAGLCPGIYQTGKTEACVKNYAVNHWLKWIVTECSGRAACLSRTKFQLHYAKMNQKKSMKVARRSTARLMLTIIWHMLQNEQPYHASKMEEVWARAPPDLTRR